jgi:hypothetical protein
MNVMAKRRLLLLLARRFLAALSPFLKIALIKMPLMLATTVIIIKPRVQVMTSNIKGSNILNVGSMIPLPII